MISISPDVMKAELDTAVAILKKWSDQISEGIPGVDIAASEDALDNFLRNLVGELKVVAGKCDTLAEVLASVG